MAKILFKFDSDTAEVAQIMGGHYKFVLLPLFLLLISMRKREAMAISFSLLQLSREGRKSYGGRDTELSRQNLPNLSLIY